MTNPLHNVCVWTEMVVLKHCGSLTRPYPSGQPAGRRVLLHLCDISWFFFFNLPALNITRPQIPRRTSASHSGHVADSEASRGSALLCGRCAPSLFLTEVNRSSFKLHRADRTRQEVGHEEGVELLWFRLCFGYFLFYFGPWSLCRFRLPPFVHFSAPFTPHLCSIS